MRRFVIWLSALCLIVGTAQALTPTQRALDAGHIRGYYNFNGTNLSHWLAAQAAVAAGTRNGKLAAVGDSTNAGHAAAPACGTTNALAYSWPHVLATYIANSSISQHWGSHTEPSAFDSRVAVSGGTTALGLTSVGGQFFGSSSAGTFGFTPLNNVDTFDVYYPSNSGLGAATIQIDSGSTTSINEVGSNNYTKVTLNATLGSHTLNWNWVSSLPQVPHIVAYNSAVKELQVMNMGNGGSKVGTWTANYPLPNTWIPTGVLGVIQPDLTIVDLTVNDSNAPTAMPAYLNNTTGLQVLINVAKAGGGDVIMMSGPPSEQGQGGVQNYNVQRQFSLGMRAVAYANNIPMIDIWDMLGGGGQWVTGLMCDDLHPNQTGYATIASLTAAALVNGFRSK
jgi:hypothetical protein